MAVEVSTNPRALRDGTWHTHVKTTGNTGALERLLSTVLAADGHKTGHLNLGELDLAAAKGSQGLGYGQWMRTPWIGDSGTYDVGDLELLGGSSHCED
jgi:hypothetical protein